jgi:hypothetical protein
MWLTNLFGRAKNISSELASYQKKLKRLITLNFYVLKKRVYHNAVFVNVL